MTDPLAPYRADPALALHLIYTNRLMAYGVAARWAVHAFRNPVQSVSLVGDLLRGGDASVLDGPIGTSFAEALVTLARTADLVDEATRLPVPSGGPEPVALADIAERVGRLAGANRAGCVVTWDDGIRGAPAVRAESDLLEQALFNLVLNGMEAAPDGTGQVAVALRLAPDAVTLRVTDNGAGVAPAIADRLFVPGATTKAHRAVAGLGLVAARLIAERSGGSVVRAVEEPGAAFDLTLPRWR